MWSIAGLNYTVVEYLNEPPGADKLKQILDMLGKSPLQVIRTGESLFKELGLNKSDDRSDEEWIEIMVNNPKLIERPIVVNGSKAALGRPPEDVKVIL